MEPFANHSQNVLPIMSDSEALSSGFVDATDTGASTITVPATARVIEIYNSGADMAFIKYRKKTDSDPVVTQSSYDALLPGLFPRHLFFADNGQGRDKTKELSLIQASGATGARIYYVIK